MANMEYKDGQILRELYCEEGLSTVEIAERADCWPSTISDWLSEFGIKSRDRIEASREKCSVNYANYSMTGEGYMQWVSQWNGDRDPVRVCRLLAVSEYGFGSVENKHVHHKNGIPWLDYPDNIELLDPSEHLSQHTKGDKNPQAKLTEEEANEVKELARDGDMTQTEIADQYGISQAHVSDLKNGNRR